VIAGVVILIMCVTGVLLTYERQVIAWADSGYRSVKPTDNAQPRSIDALLAPLRERDISPTAISVRSDPDAAVAISAGPSTPLGTGPSTPLGTGPRTLYVDRYSGEIVGEASRGGVRKLMADVRAWHRWLAVEGDGRPAARAITGWSNLLFLFIVLSGIYLWFPRQWTWARVRSLVLFNAAARGKARDFNWHNVIGSWCALPLVIVVLSALPISFGWFNTLVYRAVGEAPPAAAGGGPGRQVEGRTAQPRETQMRARGATEPQVPVSLDRLWSRAEAQVPGWQSISLRLPASAQTPAVFAIDAGDGGQPHLRSTLTLDARTGAVAKFETFSDLTLGRRIRNTMRFAHTGEVLGLPGQTIAGIASAGGSVLVWTGLALAWRRFRAWIARGKRRPQEARVQTAA
jgi:uncharacterized iron-regulated membrane protein